MQVLPSSAMQRTLVVRAQQGDRDAYEELARAAARRLFLIASRILRDPDLAEDAVQQTLVAIWQDLPSLRDPSRFDAWTYRIIIHRCRSEGRRQRRMERTVTDVSEGFAAPVDTMAAVADRDQLQRAFASLSPDHRAVVVLHHLIGLPLVEIAEILDVPPGTVGSRLHYALRHMRASLEAVERPAVEGGQPA